MPHLLKAVVRASANTVQSTRRVALEPVQAAAQQLDAANGKAASHRCGLSPRYCPVRAQLSRCRARSDRPQWPSRSSESATSSSSTSRRKQSLLRIEPVRGRAPTPRSAAQSSIRSEVTVRPGLETRTPQMTLPTEPFPYEPYNLRRTRAGGTYKISLALLRVSHPQLRWTPASNPLAAEPAAPIQGQKLP
jgi:hypothetical protein